MPTAMMNRPGSNYPKTSSWEPQSRTKEEGSKVDMQNKDKLKLKLRISSKNI